MKKYFLIFKVIILLVAAWMYLSTAQYNSQYHPGYSLSVGPFFAPTSPSDSALGAFIAILVSFLPWQWCRLGIILAMISLFQGALVWVARF